MLLVALRILFFRLLVAVPTLIAVSALVFVILRLLPADPAAMSLPPGATAEDLARLRAALGLDRSIPEQYLIWLGDLLSGDFGISIYFRRPVADLVSTALPNTLELVLSGLLLGVIVGVAGGLLMFRARGGRGEEALDVVSSAMMSIPEFLWALLLILAFGVAVPLLPFIGRMAPGMMTPPGVTGFLLLDSLIAGRLDVFFSLLLHLVLPAVALAIALAPLIMRVLRASLVEVAGDDFVTQARLRGLSEQRILFAHTLPNAALPTISLIGVQAGFMFGGTVLVEVIFGYPGLGNLIVDAVRNHDLPVIQLVALVYCVLVLAINAAVEVIYLLVNPRLRTH
ncbi:ABC transporter permease [Acuticoccus mangrovi]|uniref:ABC transporter permease n=1 Tax=Acuticoccus mangrovi TaxID=2796142 RepID=A0A934IQL1_9HYPH|nr:ABC transporter permease [Acuticoccus mangrovi]MBJ3776885.1 ABC transporter permease [Acuticoccus mangrovi]